MNLPIALFGIPVVNKKKEEAIEMMEGLITAYKKDLTAKYLSTINLQMVHQVTSPVNALPKDRELINIYRKSQGMLVHDKLLLCLARCLGSSLKESISEEELFSHLVDHLSKKHYSFFLLGGEEKTLKMCLLYLQVQHPGLKIVGAIHPTISVEGEALQNAQERDDLLLEEINKARPDVLFLNLGSPKEEIWFERVRSKIHIPLTVGVKNAFEQMSETYSKTSWMTQKGSAIFHHPKKIFKYLTSFLTFPLIATPLLINHFLTKLGATLTPKRWRRHESPNTIYISSHHAFVIKALPSIINAAACEKIYKEIPELLGQENVIFDFKNVKHLTLEGIALLLFLWAEAAKAKRFFATNIPTLLKCSLQSHNVYDLIKPFYFRTITEILPFLGNGDLFFYAITQNHLRVSLKLLGSIDQTLDFKEYLKKFSPIIQEKECVIDLKRVTYLDNAGVGFLLELKNMSGAKNILFQGYNKEIKKTLIRYRALPLLSTK